MKKKNKDELHVKMERLVWDEFKDTMRAGVIVVTVDEMANYTINLLVEFMRFKGMSTDHSDSKEKEGGL